VLQLTLRNICVDGGVSRGAWFLSVFIYWAEQVRFASGLDGFSCTCINACSIDLRLLCFWTDNGIPMLTDSTLSTPRGSCEEAHGTVDLAPSKDRHAHTQQVHPFQLYSIFSSSPSSSSPYKVSCCSSSEADDSPSASISSAFALHAAAEKPLPTLLEMERQRSLS
jgi:hypothetical protein